MSRYIIGKKENGKIAVLMSKSNPLYPPMLNNFRKPYVFTTKHIAEIARNKNFPNLKIFDVSELGCLSKDEIAYEIDEDDYIVIDSMEEWKKYF